MATSTTTKSVPGNLFQSFVEYDGKGSLDIKKSVKAFEAAFNDWIKEQAEIKPAILAELKEHERLGEGKLSAFVMHRLHMKPTKENADRISASLDELLRGGKITYLTSEGGHKKGRGTGYVLAEADKQT